MSDSQFLQQLADLQRQIDAMKEPQRIITSFEPSIPQMLRKLLEIGVDATKAKPDVIKRTFEANYPNYKN